LGVDTHLYLLDYHRYADEVTPLLDALLAGGDPEPARAAYKEAWRILAEAHQHWKHPWTPFHWTRSGTFNEGLDLLDGHIPDAYHGDRLSLGLLDPDEVTRDPRLVRDYNLRDCVCGVIVEGLCVPWSLDFPPVHVVTQCLGVNLYEHSKKFEAAICGEIYERATPAPYDIVHRDLLVSESMTGDLAEEITRIASPGTPLWADEGCRNLYLLLRRGAESNYRVLVSCH
jgi:hypothetical protein